MWKAVLVLFMTSNTQPFSMMVGQFPETFVKRSECQSFIARTRGDIDGTMTIFTKYADLGFELLHHEMSCVEDTGGEPA
jgi:hypothetical protein